MGVGPSFFFQESHLTSHTFMGILFRWKKSALERKTFNVSGPGKQELVPGSGVYILSARLHSIHSQCGKDPKKLFLLLVETFFSTETLATSLAHGSRSQAIKGSQQMNTTLNQDVVNTIKGKNFEDTVEKSTSNTM